MKTFVGIDIGASTTRIGLFDEAGQLVTETTSKTDQRDIMGPVYNALSTFDGFRGVGISSAGTLSEDGRAIVRMSNTNSWNLKIVDLIENKFDVPAILFNDCVAALLAEKFMGHGKDSNNLVYLTLSTGVGAAVLDNNRLVFGKDGNAREIGHSKIAYDSKLRCSCGEYGCVESFIGGKNMGRAVRYLRKTRFPDGESLLDRTESLTAETFFDLAERDKIARRICSELGRILAVTIANIDTVYDPEKVIIGGSVMRAHKNLLLNFVSRWMPEYTVNRLPEVTVTELGDGICLVGAGMGAINRVWVTESFLPRRQKKSPSFAISAGYSHTTC